MRHSIVHARRPRHMTPLVLRKIDPAVVPANRALGSGMILDITLQDTAGEMSLSPYPPGVDDDPCGQWLGTRVGPVKLSDAAAVLSLLGSVSVVFAGEHQAWYWQLINQRLSPEIAELLAPIGPVSAAPDLTTSWCLHIHLGGQSLYSTLTAAPDTLLRLLDAASWRSRRSTLPDDWSVPYPLSIGGLDLSIEQLASLRPGDVVFPTHSDYSSQGDGALTLAGKTWAVQIDARAHQLFLCISHEENMRHER